MATVLPANPGGTPFSTKNGVNMPPVFLDFTRISENTTNDTLEYVFKAIHDHDDGIWSPHESILIRRMIELFSQRGLDRLAAVKSAILAWEEGVNHHPSEVVHARPGMMARWSADELELVRIYLESLPPDQWTFDDHMMSVDYVVQRYLPPEELTTEAQWLATRAGLMGKVQANLSAPPTMTQADLILAALPSTVAAATQEFKLKALERNTLEYGNVRAVENVVSLTDDIRHKMRSVVMQHVEQKLLGGSPEGRSLEGDLLDNFAILNRDWRRIAVTEAGECQLQGFIANCKPGQKVKRVEQYANACAFCKKIDGKIAEVVPADHPNKDGTTQIWPGKTNIGRSASPRKRVGDQLIERTEDELWWLPAGLAHPHCRGRWVPEIEDEPGDDPEFGEWLRQILA